MCLEITEKSLRETKELKAQQKPIVAYKILNPDLKSQFKGFQWKSGENQSDRGSADLTEKELQEMEVRKGFHFFLEKPKECPGFKPNEDGTCWYWCQYPYRCLYQSHYQCQSSNPTNKIFKVEIQPEDLVAVGSWNRFESLTATKCKLLEKIK